MKKNCVCCGGLTLLSAQVLGDYSTGLVVSSPERAAWKDPLFTRAKLIAWICADCGFVHWFAENTSELAATYHAT